MRRRAAPVRLVLLVTLAACTRPGDHERRGDEAYVAGHWAAAAAEYRAVQGGDAPAVLAKLGLASLRAGELPAAAGAYRQLAAADPTRVGEAADGLELVARAAIETRDTAALRTALDGLEAVDPSRRVGRYALALADGGGTPVLLPQAIAAAPDGGTVDSLLVFYGELLAGRGNCERALGPLEAARRRSPDAERRARAAERAAGCALALGDSALAAGNSALAERWFGRVLVRATDSASAPGRRALLGVGRARVARGDTAGAIAAFTAIGPAPAAPGADSAADTTIDSVSRAATAQLDRLTAPQTAGDSARTDRP